MRRWVAAALLAAGMLGAAGAAEPPREQVISRAAFRDRLRGGWAGQMVGVSFGSIYEFRSNGRTIEGPLRVWKPEFVDNSLDQDDIYVEMTFLRTLERHGLGASHRQAGRDFRDSKYQLWHANMAARENLRQGIFPPRSGHPRYNPHADDIDFQIEADLFGLIAPGMPRAAARLCDVFGSIMNYGDGLYGGRFVAGMYARAYLETEPTPETVERVVRAGLACIPAESDYARMLRDVLDGHRRHPEDWRATWRQLQDRWGTVDLCPEGRGQDFNIDAKLNGAYLALGLLYGGGDFARTLEITTRCGQDADCNPSNAAGVLGVLYGYSRIPGSYTAGIPALAGRKFSYTEYDFPSLVAACERLALDLVRQEGGRVSSDSVTLPIQEPLPPARLEQVKAFGEERLREWALDFDRRRVAHLPVGRVAPGWTLAGSGDAMEPGVRESFQGRGPVLVLHPISRTEPAALERTLRLPAGKPALSLEVTSFPDQADADWELRVLADGAPVHSEVVHSPGAWKTVRVDLSRHAGRKVRLRVENAAGGRRDWAWEAAYIARLGLETAPR